MSLDLRFLPDPGRTPLANYTFFSFKSLEPRTHGPLDFSGVIVPSVRQPSFPELFFGYNSFVVLMSPF